MSRILDVARAAGVSVASVSRVLQGQAGVSEETRKRVQDAIVASSGLILLGLLESVRAAGLAVPGQIRIAGFDDMPWTRLVTPAITVLAQPTYEIGRSAIELLLQRIANPDQAQRRVVLRGELIARGSTVAGEQA